MKSQEVSGSSVATAETLAFVRTHVTAPARIIEVGSGDGELAAALVAAGYDVVAIENDATAADRAAARGLDVRRVDWLAFEAERADVVLFTRSLHHMHDVEAAVTRAHACLGSRGLVVVEDFAFDDATPDTIEWFAALLRALASEHDVEWVNESFAAQLARAGDAGAAWHSDHGHEIAGAAQMEFALGARLKLASREAAPYLYRYVEAAAPPAQRAHLAAHALKAERAAAASGQITLIGRRYVARK